MVSQLLHPSPLLPRALLPALSLEPLEAEERVLCSFERVRVATGAADDDAAAAETDGRAVGTLHVTSRRLVWLPSEQTSVGGGGFQVGFASIVMHALQGRGGGSEGTGGDNKSNQTPPAPAAAVYLQLDDDGEGGDADEGAFRGTGEFDDADDAGEDDVEEEEEEGEEDRLSLPPNDLRLVPLPPSGREASSSSRPSPASIAEAIFSAMCEAAAMNPTAGDEELGEDGDGSGEWFYDEKEVAEGLSAASASLSSTGAARLARYDALLQMPRAEDLDEFLDDEEEEMGGARSDEEDEGDEGDEEEEGADDDDGRFDDPEPEAATTTPKA